MARKRKHKRGHGRVVVSKSGRRWKKSATAKTGWVAVGKKKATRRKKRHAKKRKATKRHKRASRNFW